MNCIDEITSENLRRHADTFFRLISDHGRFNVAQLYEYVSLRLRQKPLDSHKSELNGYALNEKKGKLDKTNDRIIQLPVKRRLGLPNRKRDRKTIDMFETKKKPETKRDAKAGLRWYQREAIAAILTSLESNRSTLCVLATGSGKTRVASSLAADWNGRVCFIAHRDELVFQSRETMAKVAGEFVGVEKAEYRCGNTRLVSATVQTLAARLDQFGTDHFDLLICDEAHHSVSPQWQKVIRHFSKAKVLGITATPDRADEQAMGKVFDDVAYVRDIEDLIEDGYLVPIRALEVFVDDVDLSAVKSVAGDLALGELDEAMFKATESIVVKTFELSGSEQVIIFTPGVRSAYAMADRMNELKPGSAIALDGSVDTEERRGKVKDFQDGKFQYMFNCSLFTEGTDFPRVSIVANARPTKSRSLFAQMGGRPLRVLPGVVDHIDGKERAADRRAAIAASKKPYATILDFVGNSGRHSLVGPVDVLGGSYTEEEVKLAKKKVKEGQESPRQALQDARQELRRNAIAMAAAKVKARITEFDPFKTIGMRRDSEEYLSQRFGSQPMTEGQRNALKKFGMGERELGVMDKRSASKALNRLVDRAKKGLASLWQIEKLSKYTKVPDDVSFQSAMAAVEYIKRNPRPDMTHLQLLLSVKNVEPKDLF